jgi:hypothetical protein
VVVFRVSVELLSRSILFPKPTKFKFYEDSFKFVAVMGVIAFLGFIGNAIMQINYGQDWEDIILNAGDLVTVAVPPTLPAVMVCHVLSCDLVCFVECWDFVCVESFEEEGDLLYFAAEGQHGWEDSDDVF